MFVFGGTLYPSEVFSSELWMLNFTTSEWTPLFTKPVNSTESEDYSLPPVAVRGHTAHVIGSKMVVLFGLSPGEHTFLSYVQEYDFSKSDEGAVGGRRWGRGWSRGAYYLDVLLYAIPLSLCRLW